MPVPTVVESDDFSLRQARAKNTKAAASARFMGVDEKTVSCETQGGPVTVDGPRFRRDPLAAELADRKHHGLNIAIAWPLPAELERTYGEFERRVGALHPGLYIYPFSTTHVTVLTAVNFKDYPEPNEGDVRDID